MRWCLVLLVFVSAIDMPLSVRRDWTAAERACAASSGVDLDSRYHRPETTLRTLTWVSPLVVRGTVSEVKSDLTGAYPTQVLVQVVECLKGPCPQSLSVMLGWGPVYAPAYGRILYAENDYEPKFEVSEAVLLFLDTDTNESPLDDPSYYTLAANQYVPAPKGKYRVVNGQVTNALYSVESHTLPAALTEIQTVVQRQSTNCG